MSTESGTNLRKRLDPIFEAIRQITLAESIAKPTDVTAEFILGFNSAIREVNTLYNQRTGKTQSGDGETVARRTPRARRRWWHAGRGLNALGHF